MQRVLTLGWRLIGPAKTLGAEVWCIQHPREYTRPSTAAADVTVIFDYTRVDALLALVADLHKVRPFDAVVGIAENTLIPAAMLNEMLGLRGPSVSAARLMSDKWAMRQLLNARGISPVPAKHCSDAKALAGFCEQVGGPVIVKPVNGYGSFGVTRVNDAAQAGELSFDGIPMLAEQLLDGPEVSAECFSFDGRHVVLAVTDKLVGDGFVERGHSVPAAMEPDVAAEITATVRAFLDAVGMADGPSHIELKLTAAGPRIVEGHVRRGGDHINELVRLVYGVDMEDLIVGWALQRIPALQTAPVASGGAAIRFLEAQPGVVRGVVGVHDADVDPDLVEVSVDAAVGQIVAPVQWSYDRVGHVIATGADGPAAAAAAGRHADGIHIETEPALEDETDRLRRQARDRFVYKAAGTDLLGYVASPAAAAA